MCVCLCLHGEVWKGLLPWWAAPEESVCHRECPGARKGPEVGVWHSARSVCSARRARSRGLPVCPGRPAVCSGPWIKGFKGPGAQGRREGSGPGGATCGRWAQPLTTWRVPLHSGGVYLRSIRHVQLFTCPFHNARPALLPQGPAGCGGDSGGGAVGHCHHQVRGNNLRLHYTTSSNIYGVSTTHGTLLMG